MAKDYDVLSNFSKTLIDNGNGTYSMRTSGGGGGLTIGNAVSGGGANRVLFEDGSQNLAADSNFTYTANSYFGVVRTAAPAFGGDPAIWGYTQLAVGANDIPSSVQGYIKNTGSTTAVLGHIIGVLGWAEDTATGTHNAFGVEGKVTGRGNTANQTYTGFLGQSIWVGSAKADNNFSYGVQADVRIYSDEAQTTPLAQGGARGLYIPTITGGKAGLKYSIYADTDPAYIGGGLQPRTNTITSSATPSINVDTTDIFTITALATAITSMTTNLSGTPLNGQRLTIRILDNGTARAITWGASFASRGVTLPTTTVLSKYLYVGFIYNSTTSTWDCVASVSEA